MNHQNPQKAKTGKLSWRGTLTSVQPRIRLLRSFDERHHTYLGYVLRVQGAIDHEEREFAIGIGKAAQARHQFRYGDLVSGQSSPVADVRREPVEFYKTSTLAVLERSVAFQSRQSPCQGIPPELPIYRQRGHRRLDANTYKAKCRSCIWGCRMAVEIIIDQWNPDTKRYRFETFCYGPRSCPLYRAGATRKVPGRKGIVWEEEDWVDEEAVAHRGVDE